MKSKQENKIWHKVRTWLTCCIDYMSHATDGLSIRTVNPNNQNHKLMLYCIITIVILDIPPPCSGWLSDIIIQLLIDHYVCANPAKLACVKLCPLVPNKSWVYSGTRIFVCVWEMENKNALNSRYVVNCMRFAKKHYDQWALYCLFHILLQVSVA